MIATRAPFSAIIESPIVEADVNLTILLLVPETVTDVPDVPEDPDVPDAPAAPDVPEDPDVPAAPDVPEDPDVPDDPAVIPVTLEIILLSNTNLVLLSATTGMFVAVIVDPVRCILGTYNVLVDSS